MAARTGALQSRACTAGFTSSSRQKLWVSPSRNAFQGRGGGDISSASQLLSLRGKRLHDLLLLMEMRVNLFTCSMSLVGWDASFCYKRSYGHLHNQERQ